MGVGLVGTANNSLSNLPYADTQFGSGTENIAPPPAAIPPAIPGSVTVSNHKASFMR